MSWAGLASNECVSCNNLQDAVNTSVFVLKNAIPVSTKQITKIEAENYVYINTITGKASNQLVVKSNLIAATPLAYSYTLYFDFNDDYALVGFDTSTQACNATNSITVYSNSSTIAIGTALYSDAYGTPIIASCINQIYFRIGTSYITFQPSAPLQGDGYIIDLVGSCTPPTTTTTTTTSSPVTLFWSVGGQSGGGLIVFNNVNTQLLNITSNAGSPQSGTLTIPTSQLPYTIRGSWVSGSGNIVRYRVCDIFGELFFSDIINALIGSVDYTPSPIPDSASVYLTSNNVMPPICPE
jgi:hypothetical protein